MEDLPFDIPDSWTWIRLKNISNLNGGYAFKSEKFSNEGIRVIRISDFDEKGIKNKDIKRYPYSTDLDSYRIMVNDILLCMTGGTVGKSAYIKVLDEDCYINQRVALIRVNIINIIYFYSVLTSSYIFSVINTSKTSTNDNISMKLIEDFLIPIPPLNEQERIVGKIKSFEPLIAKYSFVEEELSNLESEFPKKLKKSILQYAIEGKLVKQDPNDEPASVLLERIKAEKEKLIKEGKIKRDKNESYINQGDDKNYYENLPKNWCLTTISEITNSYIGLTYKPTDVANNGIIVLRSSNIQNGKLNLNDIVRVSCKVDDKLLVKNNDIIICARNGSKKLVGKSAIVDNVNEKMTFGAFMAICKTFFYEYVYVFLQSPLFFSQLAKTSTTITINQLTQKAFNAFFIPLPPVAEQKRIKSKIDYIFKYIDITQ